MLRSRLSRISPSGCEAIEVARIGLRHGPLSLIFWTIASHPDWGEWSFSPSSGVNLTPEDGTVTIHATVNAPPDISDREFQGEILITNADDPSDCLLIPVSLTTRPMSDLDCAGQLSWNDLKHGSIAYGSFQVMNQGDPCSILNWTITSHPDWGTWKFTPSSGTNLTPNSTITVQVQVTAPDEKNQAFTGQVIVTNSDDSDDYCVIPVTLTTPLNQYLEHHLWLQRLLDRFPHAFPLIRLLCHLNR